MMTKRLLSSSSGTTAKSTAVTATRKPPFVISRRAWNEYKESHGLSKIKSSSKNWNSSEGEKPWPENFRVAGYVAGAFLIPYIITWTITSNPTLREWFGLYIPLDKLRTHFGELEWDSQCYSAELETTKKTESDDDKKNSIKHYYQFPEEAPYQERMQQKIIDNMNESDINITLSLLSSTSEFPVSEKNVVTKTVAAKTIANSKLLYNLFPSSATATTTASASSSIMKYPQIAVDFLDDANNNDNADPSSNDNRDACDDNDNINFKSNSNYGSDRLLAKGMQTMSNWSYMMQQQQQDTNSATRIASQQTELEIDIMRLEYDIKSIEQDLKDPLCTRDIDNMQQELRRSKRELSKQKWKNRFGFSG